MEKILIIAAIVSFVALIWNIVRRNRFGFNSSRLSVIVSDFLMQEAMRSKKKDFFKILFLILYWGILFFSSLCGVKFWLFFALGIFVPWAVISVSALLVVFFCLLWHMLGIILIKSIEDIICLFFRIGKFFRSKAH